MSKIQKIRDVKIERAKETNTAKIRSWFRPITKFTQYYQFGDCVIVSGKTGSGKSTFLSLEVNNFLEQGYQVASFSGELSNSQFKSWLYLQMAGKDSIRYDYDDYIDVHVPYVPKDVEKKIDNYYGGNVNLISYNMGIANTEDLLERFKWLYDQGIRIFTVDNIMQVEGKNPDKFQADVDFIHNMKEFAKAYKVLVIIVAHPRKNKGEWIVKEDISGKQDISAKVDLVFLIHKMSLKEKNEPELNGQENQFYNTDTVIEIAKNRHTGQEVLIRCNFDYQTKRLYASSEQEKNDYVFKWKNQMDL